MKNKSLAFSTLLSRSIVLSALALLGCTQNTTPVSAQTPPIATVTIDPSASTTAIDPSFLGLSMVLSETQYMIDTSNTRMNPIFEQLVRNLTHYGNSPLQIRLLNVSAVSAQTPANLTAISQLNTDTGARFFVGVDLSDGDSTIAASQASTIAT